MKTERNILIAFILNISFAIFEFIGGIITNSVSIMSDAIHDVGDSLSIGISYFLEKKSNKNPDDYYTFGYLRYSVLGATISTVILLIGSIVVIIKSISRLFNPTIVNYNGMIIFAILGIIVNFLAAYYTRIGHSINQKSVNLHMLEDVMGWIVVFIGSILIKITNINYIDSIMSIFISVYILIEAIKNLKKVIDLFLEKIPNGLSLDEIRNDIIKLDNIEDVHHIHLWSMDGFNNYATMHVKVKKYDKSIKNDIRNCLKKYGISHVTIEIEYIDELCDNLNCNLDKVEHNHEHHH